MKQAPSPMILFLRRRPVLSFLISLFGLYIMLAGVFLPYFLKKNLPEWLSPFPELSASVEHVSFNPFLLELTIEGLQLNEIQEDQTSKLAGLKQVTANLELSSVFHQALVLSELTIEQPYSRITKSADGAFLWDAWLQKDDSTNQAKPTETAKSEPPSPFPLLIHALQVNNAVVDFQDWSRKTAFQKTIGPMDLALDHLSTLPNDEGNYQLNIALPQGEQTAQFSWQGNIGLHPFYSEGRLELNQLAVKTLWEYIQDDVFYKPLSGALAVSFDYQLLTKDRFELVLNRGKATLSDVRLAAKGEEEAVVTLPSQEISGLFFDLQQKQIQIALSKTSGLTVQAERDTEGALKLARMFAERPVQQNIKTAVKKAAPEQEWAVTVDEIQLEEASIALKDHTTTPAAELAVNNINGQIKHLTLTETPAEFNLSLITQSPSQPGQQSHLKLSGDFNVKQQDANVQLDLKDFPVAMIQPYLTPVTELSIDKLLFDINGQVQYKRQQLSFNGSTQLRDVQLTNQAQSQAILAGQGIYLEGISFSQSQKTLTIDEILLDSILYPLTVLKRAEDGTVTNFSDLVKSTGAEPDSGAANSDSEAPEASTEQEDWLVNIGKITIRDNKLQFSDRGIDEPVYFNIEQLNGVVDQLSSKNLSRGNINLAGQVNGYAPFSVQGQINPLSEQAYTNIAVKMAGIALSTFSPYSQHFLNYPLVQGKLSTDLNYKLNNSELKADNELFIDQLELGNYVASDAGLGLPLPLAVSLLQNNRGEITIDLPIEGNLNDPDFQYGDVVIGALINLITKAVTSPFTLIANLAGSDADLSHLEFNAGTPEAADTSNDKVAQLATALKKRQALKLSITGQTDQSDRQTLQSRSWRSFVDQQGITVDYDNPKYQALLAQRSGEPQPTDAKQAQALESRVIAQQPVAKNQLTELAQHRAITARRLLIDAGLEEQRIFIKASAFDQVSDSTPPYAVGVTLEIK